MNVVDAMKIEKKNMLFYFGSQKKCPIDLFIEYDNKFEIICKTLFIPVVYKCNKKHINHSTSQNTQR